MKIEILDKAETDLVEGYHFYETQQVGLGAYFLESLFQTSNHSDFTLAFTGSLTGIIIACCRSVFRLRYFTYSKKMSPKFMRLSIAAVIRHGFAST